MKEEKANTEPVIELDLSELLGFSQMAKVSDDPDAVGRLLNKVGNGENPVQAPLLSEVRRHSAMPPQPARG